MDSDVIIAGSSAVLELEEMGEEDTARVYVWGLVSPHEPCPVSESINGDFVERFVHSRSGEIAYGQIHLVNFRGFLNDRPFSIDDPAEEDRVDTEEGGNLLDREWRPTDGG